MDPKTNPTPDVDLPILTLRAVFLASSVGLALYLAQTHQPEMAFVSMVVAGSHARVVIVNEISTAAVKKMWPLLETDDILCGFYTPDDGSAAFVQPPGVDDAGSLSAPVPERD